MGTWKLEATVDEARPGVAGLDIFLFDLALFNKKKNQSPTMSSLIE
jgi:hypothetical protein